MIQDLIGKPFDREDELKTMKVELSRLEREINIKIQEKKLEQPNEEIRNDINNTPPKTSELAEMEVVERKSLSRVRVISIDEVGQAAGMRR